MQSRLLPCISELIDELPSRLSSINLASSGYPAGGSEVLTRPLCQSLFFALPFLVRSQTTHLAYYALHQCPVFSEKRRAVLRQGRPEAPILA